MEKQAFTVVFQKTVEVSVFFNTAWLLVPNYIFFLQNVIENIKQAGKQKLNTLFLVENQNKTKTDGNICEGYFRFDFLVS